MTKEEFIEHWRLDLRPGITFEWFQRDLEALLASEREACAKVADELCCGGDGGGLHACGTAAAIRARK